MFVFWLHQDYFADHFVAKITSLMKSLYTVSYIVETILVTMERRKKI